MNATLTWFSPPKQGTVAYKGARIKIIEPLKLGAAGIKAAGVQPDPKQAHKRTVVHRRLVMLEMAGELAVYNQALNRMALKPAVGIQT